MKIAFIVLRNNFYRFLAPIVDEALSRGHEVVCWHDYSQPRGGLKGYEFPDIDCSPRFFNGIPEFVKYSGEVGLRELVKDKSLDAVYSLFGPNYSFPEGVPNRLPKWIAVQNAIDFFLNQTPTDLVRCDKLALYSPIWCDVASQVYDKIRNIGDEFTREEKVISDKIEFVGWPELDQCKNVNTDELRQRWAIPEKQPVVVLIPFSNPSTFSPRLRKIYYQPNRWRQVGGMFAGGGLAHWKDILNDWNDGRVVDEIGRFCKKNGAFLIAKARKKTPVPDHVVKNADLILYDEEVYPATIIEVMMLAQICFHYYSLAASEAVVCGAKSFAIQTHQQWTQFSAMEQYDRSLMEFCGLDIFDCQGVSETVNLNAILHSLADWKLSDCVVNEEQRKKFIEKYFGLHDLESSGRCLALAE